MLSLPSVVGFSLIQTPPVLPSSRKTAQASTPLWKWESHWLECGRGSGIHHLLKSVNLLFLPPFPLLLEGIASAPYPSPLWRSLSYNLAFFLAFFSDLTFNFLKSAKPINIHSIFQSFVGVSSRSILFTFYVFNFFTHHFIYLFHKYLWPRAMCQTLVWL